MDQYFVWLPSMRRSLPLACLSVLGFLSWTMPARAQALPPVNLGFTSFLDGGYPAGPGVYFNQYGQYYRSSRFSGGLNQRNPEIDVFVGITQLLFLADVNLPIKAKPGLNVLIPEALIDLDVAGTGPPSAHSGIGDVLIGPELQFDPILKCDGTPLFVHRLELQMTFPTGDYTTSNEINPASGIFSFDPYWAGTLFFTEKLSTSFRFHYLWSGVNHDPPASLQVGKVQAGEAFHMNYTLEYQAIPKQFLVGINGYYLQQTTDPRIDGASVPNLRERVFAIGPGLLWSTKDQRRLLFLNLYFESGAENRFEGTRLGFRYVHKF